MTADQQFVIALAQILVPVVSTVLVLIGTIVHFWISMKTQGIAKDAANASRRAEDASNHHSETLAAVNSNFQAAVNAITPTVVALTDHPAVLPIVPVVHT